MLIDTTKHKTDTGTFELTYLAPNDQVIWEHDIRKVVASGSEGVTLKLTEQSDQFIPMHRIVSIIAPKGVLQP